MAFKVLIFHISFQNYVKSLISFIFEIKIKQLKNFCAKEFDTASEK